MRTSAVEAYNKVYEKIVGCKPFSYIESVEDNRKIRRQAKKK